MYCNVCNKYRKLKKKCIFSKKKKSLYFLQCGHEYKCGLQLDEEFVQ